MNEEDEEEELEEEHKNHSDFCEDEYEEKQIQKQENDKEYEQSFQVIIDEIVTDEKTDKINEGKEELLAKTDLKDTEEVEKWVLGCKHMCIEMENNQPIHRLKVSWLPVMLILSVSPIAGIT